MQACGLTPPLHNAWLHYRKSTTCWQATSLLRMMRSCWPSSMLLRPVRLLPSERLCQTHPVRRAECRGCPLLRPATRRGNGALTRGAVLCSSSAACVRNGPARCTNDSPRRYACAPPEALFTTCAHAARHTHAQGRARGAPPALTSPVASACARRMKRHQWMPSSKSRQLLRPGLGLPYQRSNRRVLFVHECGATSAPHTYVSHVCVHVHCSCSCSAACHSRSARVYKYIPARVRTCCVHSLLHCL